MLAITVLYSRAVYVLEEAHCDIAGNSSIVNLHTNRKARASAVRTKFGIQVGPKGETVSDTVVRVLLSPAGKTWDKTWSELGVE